MMTGTVRIGPALRGWSCGAGRRTSPPGIGPALRSSFHERFPRASVDPELSGVGLAWGVLHAVREAAPPSRVDPAIAEAVQRQTTAMRALSRRALPEPDAAPDDAPAPIGQARIQRRRQAAATEAAALRRCRAERAGATALSAPRPRPAAGEVA